MKRVVILGRGAAGKSTLARQLGEITGLPVVELDKIFWRSGLSPTPRVERIQLQESLVRKETWVLDGDLGPYDAVEVRLRAADTIILLNFSLFRCAWRVLRRAPERADFWRWVLDYRRQSVPRLTDAISRCAPNADLLLLQPHATHHAAIIFVNSEEHRALVPGAVLFLRHAVYVVSRLLARRVALADLGERETRIVNRWAAWVVGIQDAPRDVRRDGQHTHSRERYLAERAPPWCRMVRVVALGARRVEQQHVLAADEQQPAAAGLDLVRLVAPLEGELSHLGRLAVVQAHGQELLVRRDVETAPADREGRNMLQALHLPAPTRCARGGVDQV